VDDDNVIKPIYYGKIEVQNNGTGVLEPTVKWLNEFNPEYGTITESFTTRF